MTVKNGRINNWSESYREQKLQGANWPRFYSTGTFAPGRELAREQKGCDS